MKKDVLTFESMQYIISYPEGYHLGEKYPVILFLHGAGSRGKDIDTLLGNPYFQITQKHSDFPFVTVAPHCHADTWFDLFETLEKLAKAIVAMPFTDGSRIYLIGASMGGYATWQLAMSMPEYFAAIVPICGGGMYWNAGRLVNVPVRAFHGANGEVVCVKESVKMVEAVKRSGGKAELIVYPEIGHNAWSDTYSNWAVFEWLLSHKNENVEQVVNYYKDNMLFG